MIKKHELKELPEDSLDSVFVFGIQQQLLLQRFLPSAARLSRPYTVPMSLQLI
jgi:hypothetical protein